MQGNFKLVLFLNKLFIVRSAKFKIIVSFWLLFLKQIKSLSYTFQVSVLSDVLCESFEVGNSGFVFFIDFLLKTYKRIAKAIKVLLHFIVRLTAIQMPQHIMSDCFLPFFEDSCASKLF